MRHTGVWWTHVDILLQLTRLKVFGRGVDRREEELEVSLNFKHHTDAKELGRG